jgi:transcriptional repressor NrdR
MLCPFCGGDETRVVDSRTDDLGRIRKRRCATCSQPFSTVERITVESLMVHKRDGRRERFSRAKLAKAITRAASLYALSPTDVNAFVDRVVQKIQPGAPGLPVSSSEIGGLVLQELQDSRAITDVARIRYALVFFGRANRPGGTRGLQKFLDWLEETYGSPIVDSPTSTPWRVIKRDGRVEPFQRGKLEHSLEIALKGCGTEQQVKEVARSIANQVHEELEGQPLVTSHQVATEVLKPLRRRDAMAYLRYASIAKRYRSVDDFWMEALGMEQ